MAKKKHVVKTGLQEFNNFVIFQTETGKVNIDVFFQDETLWLTQKKMAELFEVERPAITKHLKNIFESHELDENSVCSKMEHTAKYLHQHMRKLHRFKSGVEKKDKSW